MNSGDSHFVGDDDFVDADIMCLAGKVVAELVGMTDADQMNGGRKRDQETIVVSAASSQAATVSSEGDPGHQDDVE